MNQLTPVSADKANVTLTTDTFPAPDPEQVSQIASLSEAIDVTSPLSISNFGGDLGRTTGTFTDSILSRARSGDIDDMGEKLAEIVLAAKSFNLAALDSRATRTPIIGGLIAALMRAKTRAMGQFESIDQQINRMVHDVATIEVRLIERAKTLDEMHDAVKDEQRLLMTYALAADTRLKQLGSEISGMLAGGINATNAETLGIYEASAQSLGKRRDDLVTLYHAAGQALPMIRLIQANNLVLVEKFRTIQTLTLPTWKRSFLMALALDEQKSAVSLANEIDDATNHFMKRNSELLRENAVATARSSQRLVIDIETLKTVHDNIIATLDDVRLVHEEGARKRAAAMDQLRELKAQMEGTVGNVRLAVTPAA